MTKANTHTIKWFYGASRGKNHAVLFVDAVGSISMKEKHPKKVYGFPYTGRFYLQCDGTRSIGAVDHTGMMRVLDRLGPKLPEFFYRYGTKMLAVERKIRKWTDSVKKTEWRKASHEKLRRSIREHCTLTSMLWAVPLAYAYYFYLNDILVERFVERLRTRLGEKLDGLLPAILAAEKMSEISEEKRELLMLARRVHEGGIDRDVVEKHWQKYAYLNNYYYSGHGYSFMDILRRLEEETRKSKDEIEKELRGLEPITLDYRLFSPKEKVMIRAMKRMAYAFQYADESLAYCIHNIRGAYTEAAKRLGISYEQLVSMTLAEIEKSLRIKKLAISKDELSARYEDHVAIVADGKTAVLIGAECEAFKNMMRLPGLKDVQELKGTVAHKGGVVRGTVHIISHADEIASFRQGEILVTAMTNPSFVPAMKKAAAIVTNDGGLLCHAAIVSRELLVPCVIGTKIATKVLKDGDLVEVDAERGIVKKLS